MSERHKTHNGRDLHGHFKVRRADVDDLTTDPEGADYLRDDVRLGGAVEDIGLGGVERAKEIAELVEENRENVSKATGKTKE